MRANKILLQKKYVRLIKKLSEKANISIEKALDIFYNSHTYQLMSEGVADMHCMSDEYLIQDLMNEIENNNIL